MMMFFSICFVGINCLQKNRNMLLFFTRMHYSRTRTARSLPYGGGGSLSRDRQTRVKILPCPKLVLRAVKMFIKKISYCHETCKYRTRGSRLVQDKNSFDYVLRVFTGDCSGGIGRCKATSTFNSSSSPKNYTYSKI